MQRFARWSWFVMRSIALVQVSLSAIASSTPAVDMLLSGSGRVVFSDEMDANNGWVTEGPAGGISFSDGVVSISASSGNVDPVVVDFTASLPIPYSASDVFDEIELVVVVNQGILVNEPGANIIWDHSVSFGNVKLDFEFSGLLIIRPDGPFGDFPLLIKVNYDLSSGNSKMTVNGVIPLQANHRLDVQTDYVGVSEYSVNIKDTRPPTNLIGGWVAIDRIALEIVTD